MTQEESRWVEGVSDVTIATVRFEYCQDALGIGTARPRIS